jgi:2-polyprenyl-3-methyl-5-hydroxy-6-metoxy-1,4-benzoquinol methylase
MKSLWDDRFAGEEYIYGEQPNKFFATCLSELNPGKLLLPGEGEGRNAVWAARLGWDVTAIDYSVAGRAKALQLAQRNNVDFTDYLIGNLEDYKPGAEKFDAIAFVYIHLPPALRTKVHHALVKALKPGGRIILEAFHPNQLQFDSGGPKNADMLYSIEMLQAEFEMLQMIQLVYCTEVLNEGQYHQGKAALVRMQAQKLG